MRIRFRYSLLVASILAVSIGLGQVPDLPPGLLQRLPLEANRVYVVPILPSPPTTILLPDVPTAFEGVGFTMTSIPSSHEPVYIQYTPGMNFFTVRALMKDAHADLNVVLNNKIYAFRFVLAEKEAPVRALTLYGKNKDSDGSKPTGHGRLNRLSLTPDKLIALLDTAKNYFLAEKEHPGILGHIQVSAPGTIIDYLGFQALTDFVWRFDTEDTLVFRAILSNITPFPIYYDPQEIGVKIGSNMVYWKSIADASGVIPPALFGKDQDGNVSRISTGQSVIYFAISGNPDGTRANISLKNHFNILIRRIQEPVQSHEQ